MKKTKRANFSLFEQPVASDTQSGASLAVETVSGGRKKTRATATPSVTQTRVNNTAPVMSTSTSSSSSPPLPYTDDPPYCGEEFSIDDNITRRIIYPLAPTTHENVVSTQAFNFTHSMMAQGATQWGHIKEPYLAFALKLMNLSAYSIGNKRADYIVTPPPAKRKKQTATQQQQQQVAHAHCDEMEADLRVWLGKLRKSQQVQVEIETLFDAQNRRKVAGFRIFLHSKLMHQPVTKQQPPPPSSSHQHNRNVSSRAGGFGDDTVAQPHENMFRSLTPHFTTQYAPVDVLSSAFRFSFAECQILREQYTDQRQKRITLMSKSKKQKSTPDQIEQDPGLHLAPAYSYVRCGSNARECFTNLLRKVLTLDRSRHITDDDVLVSPASVQQQAPPQLTFPAFRDSRDLMKPAHTQLDDDAAYNNIIRQTFTKEAAMFYHVRTDNILEEQRNINTYLNPTQRLFGDVAAIDDVKALTQLSMDCPFYGYYNPRTTYQLANEHAQAEFLIRMPFPHRMGAILPTRDIQPLVEAARLQHERRNASSSATTTEPTRSFNIMTGDDDEVVVEDMDEEPGNRSPPLIVDQDYLDNHDLDGSMQIRLVDNPIYYGYDSVQQKPLGLHNTRFNVTHPDILHAKLHETLGLGKNVMDCDALSEDVKQRFIVLRRADVQASLVHTANAVFRVQLRSVKLLACDADNYTAGKTTASKEQSNAATSETSGTTTCVYNASTQNYIQHDTTAIFMDQYDGGGGGGGGDGDMNSTHDAAVESEEEEPPTIHDDDDDDGGGNDTTDAEPMDEEACEKARMDAIDAYYREHPDFLGDANDVAAIAAAAVEEARRKKAAERPGNKRSPIRCQGNRALDETVPFLTHTNNNRINLEWEAALAEANYDVFVPVLEKWRKRGNALEDVCDGGDLCSIDEWKLKRDIDLRLNVQNTRGTRNRDRAYFTDPVTRQVPPARYAEYRRELDRQTGAKAGEVWHEFFNNADVSYATEGVRGDWNKATTIVNQHKKISHSHEPRISRLDVRPYHQYKIWCYNLFSVIIMIHYNFKLMYNNYIFKYHHCRWYVDCNNPKHNALNHGDNMGGKSFMLQGVKKTCPSRVGDMVTAITSQAFNVDRNMNDMLIIIEEMEARYLGINAGSKSSGGGNSQGVDDAINFFKSRLTSGVTMVLSFFIDEENGNRRDCKESHSSCQGSYLCATNAKLADADAHLLSRFILLSVPKNFGAKNNGDTNAMEKKVYQCGTDKRHADVMYDQHQCVHRLYLFTEKCVKAYVLDNDVFGVSVDAASIYIEQILNTVQSDFKIVTKHDRKRNAILEMARSMAISFACWNALTSPVLQYLQYHPKTYAPLGINLRMIVRGIFPFLVITKDMVIDAMTSLSSIWQHDHLKNVLAAAIKSCQLTSTANAKYRQVTPSESDNAVVEYDKDNNIVTNRPRSASHGSGKYNKKAPAPHRQADAGQQHQQAYPPPQQPVIGGIGRNNMPYFQVQTVPDYNYVSMMDLRQDVLFRNIARQLGELQISANTVEHILKDLSDEVSDTALPPYRLELDVPPTDAAYGTLVVNTDDTQPLIKRKLVIFDQCPKTRKSRISFLVSHLKEQMPAMLPDSKVQDLRRYQRLQNRINGVEDADMDDYDNDEEEIQQQQQEPVTEHTPKKSASKRHKHNDDDEGSATSEVGEDDEEEEDDSGTTATGKKKGKGIFGNSLRTKHTLMDLFDEERGSSDEISSSSSSSNSDSGEDRPRKPGRKSTTKKKKKSPSTPKEKKNTKKSSSKQLQQKAALQHESDPAIDAIEADDTLTRLIALLKRSALYHDQSETPIIKTIRKKYENSVYGLTHVPLAQQDAINNQYRTVYSDLIPYDQYATAEAADPIKHQDAFPYMPARLRHRKDFSHEISFHDTMKTLVLRRRPDRAPLVIPNYAYISPSAQASLSIYDTTIKGNDIIKATQNIYNHSSSWVQREDIDYTSAKAHLARLGYEPIDVEDPRFLCPCFHDFLYQIHTDYSRPRIEKEKRRDRQNRADRATQHANNPNELRRIAREEEDELLHSVMCEYPLCDMFNRVTIVGDIIKSILYGVDQSTSIPLDAMLMANSDAMAEYFVPKHLQNRLSPTGTAVEKQQAVSIRKRIDFQSQKERAEARLKTHTILKQRLIIGNASTIAAEARQRQSLAITEKLKNKRTLDESNHATTKQSHKHTATTTPAISASEKLAQLAKQSNSIAQQNRQAMRV